MKLKYYLRGLGIGIVVTAVIMSIAAGGRKETLSDTEIKERARELGMTEQNSVLADLQKEPEEKAEADEASAEETGPAGIEDDGEPAEAPESTPAQMQEPTEVPKPTSTSAPTSAPTPTSGPTPTPAPTSTPTLVSTPKPGVIEDSNEDEQGTENTMSGEGVISIEVKSGESSFTICQKLEDAGLVASASAFDSYLCQNGYDKKLKAGTHEIPAAAQPEEIAKLLSS